MTALLLALVLRGVPPQPLPAAPPMPPPEALPDSGLEVEEVSHPYRSVSWIPLGIGTLAGASAIYLFTVSPPSPVSPTSVCNFRGESRGCDGTIGPGPTPTP